MDYEKLRPALLEFLTKKPYVPTVEREKLTDQVIELVQTHDEPRKEEKAE
jgi:putative lipoic acid-binding regulatory protein